MRQILTGILAVALIIAFAALIHHASHDCATIPGTPGWCQ
jgi:hypothetical protein